MTRAYLVGSPRSGTTLLQRLLADDPRVTSFPESHFFWHLFGPGRIRRRLGVVRRAEALEGLRAFARRCGVRDDVPSAGVRSAFRTRPWFRAFRDLLDGIARDRGACCWIEKTPIHLHYVDVIAALDPAARFLHIVRSGEDVVASVHRVSHGHPERWGGPRGLDACVERWLLDVSLHRRCLGRPGHWFVRFEDLLAEADATVRDALGFLGIAPEAPVGPPADFRDIVGEDEPWKAAAARPVSIGEVARATTTLSEEELRAVRARTAGVDLSPFGRGARP